MFPQASPIEILQLTLGTTGVCLSFWRLWISLKNGLAITSVKTTDLRRFVAETQVLGELFRLFALGILMIIGIISVLLPPPPVQFVGIYPPLLQSFLTRCGLIALSIILVTDSLVQEYRRRSFLAYIDKQSVYIEEAKSDV